MDRGHLITPASTIPYGCPGSSKKIGLKAFWKIRKAIKFNNSTLSWLLCPRNTSWKMTDRPLSTGYCCSASSKMYVCAQRSPWLSLCVSIIKFIQLGSSTLEGICKMLRMRVMLISNVTGFNGYFQWSLPCLLCVCSIVPNSLGPHKL